MRAVLPLPSGSGALADTARFARAAEGAGAEVLSVSEIDNDPMLQLTVAAGVTKRMRLMSNIVVAFARSPMTLATQAAALQEYSGGRLILGLGSQIKPHIERRFSMPWSAPSRRMGEYVRALKAIWSSWSTGERLSFDGEFYRHTLMIPEFVPTLTYEPPKIFLAAVGERMTEVAGRHAEGVIIHSFATEKYISEVMVPALRRGAEAAGRTVSDLSVVATPFVIAADTDEGIASAREQVRRRIAFYGSTPAYRPVLAVHGWDELGVALTEMSKTADPARWEKMGRLVDDDVLAAFAVEGAPESVGALVVRRLGVSANHVNINPNGIADLDTMLRVMTSIESAAEMAGKS